MGVNMFSFGPIMPGACFKFLGHLMSFLQCLLSRNFQIHIDKIFAIGIYMDV